MAMGFAACSSDTTRWFRLSHGNNEKQKNFMTEKYDWRKFPKGGSCAHSVAAVPCLPTTWVNLFRPPRFFHAVNQITRDLRAQRAYAGSLQSYTFVTSSAFSAFSTTITYCITVQATLTQIENRTILSKFRATEGKSNQPETCRRNTLGHHFRLIC